VEGARAPPYGRVVNVKEEIVTTRTRTLTALAALSVAVAAYPAERLASGTPEAAAATPAKQVRGYLAGGSRVQDGVRITVEEFRSARAAQAEADHMLMKAYSGHRGSKVCDLTQRAMSVPGIPGASGVIMHNRPWTGAQTKTATIVFTKGSFTFRLSTEAKPAALRVGALKRASLVEYRRLAA